MTSFQEFLQQKADEQKAHLRREKREEWIEAVDRLLKQVTAWLEQSDPEGLLEIAEIPLDKLESGLGPYTIPSLQIRVGDLAFRVIPVARNVVGSPLTSFGEGAKLAGRVDVTDGVRKYILMRILRDGQESWEVRDDQLGAMPLDRDRLEAIIRDLLS